ncbi:parvalbumin beta-like [Ranitomeya variabilis]|uniref:parvalbumin beta-like n=1 Tax=Ranitomeya variabilis TaxID=490064 RepID=UPI00405615C3
MSSIGDLLSPIDIANALASVQAPNSFEYKSFFQKTGMVNIKSAEIVKRIFNFLDRDTDGVLEYDDVSFVLVSFGPNSRKLTSAEIEAFIRSGSGSSGSNISGKISFDEFEAMVRSAKE